MAGSDISGAPSGPGRHIAGIFLDERMMLRRTAEIEHERKVAIFDLLEENHFSPVDVEGGPFNLHLSIAENRLVFDIRDIEDAPLRTVILALSPFRRIIREYFAVCESYFAAIRTAQPSRIEAIDMGRRGLHNEGSSLLCERLDGKIELDENTARRLFTLICVLHFKN